MVKTKSAYLKIFLNDLLSINLRSVSVSCNRSNGKFEELEITMQQDNYSGLLKRKSHCALEVTGQPVWEGIIQHVKKNGEHITLKCISVKRRVP
jgi:hypothetical protein